MSPSGQVSLFLSLIFEPCHDKTCLQGRYKPGCTATKDGLRLEISDLGSRGIVKSM